MPIRRIGRPGLIGLAARTAVVAGTAQAVQGGVARNQQRRSQAAYEQQQYEAAQQQAQVEAAARQEAAQRATPAVQPAPAAPAGNDIVSQLQQLATLMQQGVLSPDEYAAAKAKLLA